MKWWWSILAIDNIFFVVLSECGIVQGCHDDMVTQHWHILVADRLRSVATVDSVVFSDRVIPLNKLVKGSRSAKSLLLPPCE